MKMTFLTPLCDATEDYLTKENKDKNLYRKAMKHCFYMSIITNKVHNFLWLLQV